MQFLLFVIVLQQVQCKNVRNHILETKIYMRLKFLPNTILLSGCIFWAQKAKTSGNLVIFKTNYCNNNNTNNNKKVKPKV